MAAWCVAGTGRVVRAGDYQAVHAAHRREDRLHPEIRIGLVNSGRSLPVHKRGADAMGARFNRQTKTARIRYGDFVAIDRDVHDRARGAANSTADAELVFRIHWKGVLDEQAAARAEREAFDVPVL